MDLTYTFIEVVIDGNVRKLTGRKHCRSHLSPAVLHRHPSEFQSADALVSEEDTVAAAQAPPEPVKKKTKLHASPSSSTKLLLRSSAGGEGCHRRSTAVFIPVLSGLWLLRRWVVVTGDADGLDLGPAMAERWLDVEVVSAMQKQHQNVPMFSERCRNVEPSDVVDFYVRQSDELKDVCSACVTANSPS
nr:hypothetical protein Iba_chr09eCG8790 [Ipomoea batatas]